MSYHTASEIEEAACQAARRRMEKLKPGACRCGHQHRGRCLLCPCTHYIPQMRKES